MAGYIGIEFTEVNQIACRRDVAVTALVSLCAIRVDHCQTRLPTISFGIGHTCRHTACGTQLVNEPLAPISAHAQITASIIYKRLRNSDNTSLHGIRDGKCVAKATRMDVAGLISTIAFTKANFDPKSTGAPRNGNISPMIRP